MIAKHRDAGGHHDRGEPDQYGTGGELAVHRVPTNAATEPVTPKMAAMRQWIWRARARGTAPVREDTPTTSRDVAIAWCRGWPTP